MTGNGKRTPSGRARPRIRRPARLLATVVISLAAVLTAGAAAVPAEGTKPSGSAQTGRGGNGSGFPAPFNGRHGRPSMYPGNLAGSGGISRIWRMPPWQRGFDTSGNGSGTPCGTLPRGKCREVPDVSALAAAGLAPG